MAFKNTLREDLSAKFLAALKEDKIPWHAVWQQLRPMNAATGKPYRGVNAMNLSFIADDQCYTDPRWCTFQHAKEKGWKIRKGEHASPVEYWAYYDREQKKLLPWPEAQRIIREEPERAAKDLLLSCRLSLVFNAAQIEGIPPLEKLPATDIETIRSQRDTLLQNMGVGYKEQGSEAYYSPAADSVVLPPATTFDDVYAYMCTLLHECGHATSHPTRLDRAIGGVFGSPEYAREELRAEIASAFVSQALGIEMPKGALEQHFALHKAYIQSWASALEKNPDELYAAIKDANAIADYLMEKGEFEAAIEKDLKSMDTLVPKEREKELFSLWESETNAPETEEWREELTAAEAALVETWDTKAEQGMSKLANDILKLQKKPRPRFTDEQLQHARHCSALEYARSQGYELVRVGSFYTLRQHDSMRFSSDGSWFWNSRGLKGGAIDFIMHYENRTLPEAVLILNGLDPHATSEVKQMSARFLPKEEDLLATKEEKTLELPPKAEDLRHIFAYLATTRGIDYQLIKQLVMERRLYESQTLSNGKTHNNAVFLALDEQGHPRGATIRGCSTGSSFKMEASGSNKSYPFELHGKRGEETTLYIFESPIDALSHATLYKSNHVEDKHICRISIGGNGKVEAILRTLQQRPIKSVVFCLDNDDAGQKIYDRLRAELLASDTGLTSENISQEKVPSGKDWNEYLLQLQTTPMEKVLSQETSPSAVATGTHRSSKKPIRDQLSDLKKEAERRNNERAVSSVPINNQGKAL